MSVKEVDITQIDDIIGFRIIVKDINGCYQARDIIHKCYDICQDRFKNYINEPKPNFYQSIHTIIITKPYNRKIEIQIRTDEMEEIAEFGTASHSVYKQNKEKLFGIDFPKYLDKMLEAAYAIMIQFAGTEIELVAYEEEIKRVVKNYNFINSSYTK